MNNQLPAHWPLASLANSGRYVPARGQTCNAIWARSVNPSPGGLEKQSQNAYAGRLRQPEAGIWGLRKPSMLWQVGGLGRARAPGQDAHGAAIACAAMNEHGRGRAKGLRASGEP